MANKKMTPVNIVNAINNQVSKRYAVQFPAITENNFSDMADQLSNAAPEILNAWQDTLINLVGLQIVKNKRSYEGYFKNLYKADTPTENIQLLMSDLLDVKTYSPDANATDFFEDAKADIETQYITSTKKTVIPLSENADTLIAAFVNPGAFENLLTGLTSRMYDTLEKFDVEVIKEMINTNIEDGNLYLRPMAAPVDKDTSLAFTKDVKKTSEDMRVDMSNEYNLSGMNTWTPTEDGVLMLTTDVKATAETYNLAQAFNKSYIDLQNAGQAITIPSNGLANGNVYGAYFDRDLLEIRNKTGFPKMASQYFGNTLTMKRWLHNQKVMAVSFFNNGIFYIKPDAIGLTSATLASRDGSTNINRGGKKKLYVKNIEVPTGKYADKFGTWTIAPTSGSFSSKDTAIDTYSGKLIVGKDETVESIVATWTSHLDPTKTATITITINQ